MVFHCFFSVVHCFFTVCRLRAFLAFPWQTVEPDMLQQLMGKILQGCSAAALAAPSSTGEGTLVLLFLISHWAFFFFFPDFTKIRTLSFIYFLKMSFASFHIVSKCTNAQNGWKRAVSAFNALPHGRPQPCLFQDPRRDPVSTFPG